MKDAAVKAVPGVSETAREGQKYLLDDRGFPLDVGGGDVMAVVENIPTDPTLAYTAGWNDCRAAALPLASVEQGGSSALAEKRWPFVETPVQFADRLAGAMTWAPSLLSALRHVLIENPATLAHMAPAIDAARTLSRTKKEPSDAG